MGNYTTYSPQDQITNHRIYSGFLQLGIEDGWGRHDKLENFHLMMKISEFTKTPLNDSTILDVGCGTGDLVATLSEKRIKDYVGIDIFQPAVEKARQKYPQYKFIMDDFLKHTFRRKFDFVMCSGAMTTRLDTDNYDIITSWIPKMWQLAKRGVVFNFLIANNSESSDLFFYDPNRVLEICRAYIPEARIETLTTSAGMGNSFHEMHVYLY